MRASSFTSTSRPARIWNAFANCWRTPPNASAWCRWDTSGATIPPCKQRWKLRGRAGSDRFYRFRASIDKLIFEDEAPASGKISRRNDVLGGCHLDRTAVALLGRPKKRQAFFATMERRRTNSPTTIWPFWNMTTLSPRSPWRDFIRTARAIGIWRFSATNGSARMQPYTFPSQLMVDLAKPAGPYKAGEQRSRSPRRRAHLHARLRRDGGHYSQA